MTSNNLSPSEFQRYARHLSIPEFGKKGQLKLKASSVLCIGAGGLGSPIAMYLAAAGVGRLGIVDADVVDTSNLQRQLLHGTADVGKKKIASAKARLADINPEIDVDVYDCLFKSDVAMELAGPYDLIIDGTDNFPTRYLSNDVCVLLKKPNIYGSIFRFEGQSSVFAPHLGGPCYRCMFPTPPAPGLVPSCAEGGVLGVLPGIIGMVQSIEAIKLLTGIGDPLLGRLLHFDALGMKFREFKLKRDPQCPICGDHPTVTELIDYEAFCGLPSASSPDPDVAGADQLEVTVHDLKKAIDAGAAFTLLDVRESFELEIASLSAVTHVPLRELATRHEEIAKSGPVYILCHSGIRSLHATHTLRELGYSSAFSIAGGITAWSEKIDSSVPIY
ncbi:MAG: molybdopterin/thiamine biosynthesis adenylyltransferase/rhodanese-related sulfurtransferase [Verrucomicrobiales bacterium]|jgi:molybdopterin/thiamine biosynthesis adenylyltransferase/rhodanese-related sulfurtransferase